MLKTLEQKSNETESINCHNCGRELQIPKNFNSLKKDKEYKGFYKSPEGNPHCDRYCFEIFTED